MARAGDRRSPLQVQGKSCALRQVSEPLPQSAQALTAIRNLNRREQARLFRLIRSARFLSPLATLASLTSGREPFGDAQPYMPRVAARPYSRRDPRSEITPHHPPQKGVQRVSDASAASGGSSELSESTETSNRAIARVRRLRLRNEDPLVREVQRGQNAPSGVAH